MVLSHLVRLVCLRVRYCRVVVCVFHGSSVYLFVLHMLHLFGFVHAVVGSDSVGGCCSVCGSLGGMSSVELEDLGVV